MKIWEKNYVLTMTLILIILFFSIFFIQQYSFRNNLTRYCDNANLNESRLEYSFSNLINENGQSQKLDLYCESLTKQKIYIKLQDEEKVIVNSQPFEWESLDKIYFQIIKYNKVKYICISNRFEISEDNSINIYYMEEIDELYEFQQKQLVMFLFIGFFITLVLAVTLYNVMKKIYYPINNIAHELRTPLTAIQGYAQYIMLGTISHEDTIYASKQIDEKAQYMNALVEHLLIIGNVKDGKITMENIETISLLNEVKQYYPSLIIDNQTKYLYGDKTLLVSLLLNILSNTSRQSESISLFISENKITIYNKEDYIDEEMITILNKNESIPKEKIKGKGIGVSLCHEIVKLHHGKLQYNKDDKEGGIKINILLWQYR